MFSYEFAKVLRTALFIGHHQWLLFKVDESWQDGTGVTYTSKLIVVNCDQLIFFEEPQNIHRTAETFLFCKPLRKRVRIWSLFLVRTFPYLDWIRRFTVNLRIHSKYWKIRTLKNSIFGLFLFYELAERWENDQQKCALISLVLRGNYIVIDILKAKVIWDSKTFTCDFQASNAIILLLKESFWKI